MLPIRKLIVVFGLSLFMAGGGSPGGVSGCGRMKSILISFVHVSKTDPNLALGQSPPAPSPTPTPDQDQLTPAKLIRIPPIIAALIGLIGAIVGGFFTVIVWPTLKIGLEKGWHHVMVRFVSGRNFEYRYLDWVISEHRYLPILPTTLVPINEAQNQELDKLYVSLSVADGAQGMTEVMLGSALKDNPLLVILGDPGAGKTTILRFLALTLARARRKNPEGRKGAEYREEKVKIQVARARAANEFGYQRFPLPVFVYLNRLRDLTKWGEGRSLLDALRDEWKSVDRLRDFPEEFFDDKLKRGECVFLFDAFDELGTEDAREVIANHIGRLASSAPDGNRFVVTSRIVGYSGQLARFGFQSVTIQRLSWDLISQLVTKWYASLNVGNLTEPLLATLKANPRIYDLAVNPMLLSLIALVQYVRGLIPDRRHVLYDECVKILVERRFAPPGVRQEYDKVVPGDEATTVLRSIASDMHRAHLREVPREELEDTYIPIALETMPNTKAAAVAPSEVLSNIEARSQLLVERGLNEKGQPVMAFSHLTFQEYLTSVALREDIAARREDVVSGELLGWYQADSKWWEEVALLYAAQLDTRQRDAFFDRLYPQRKTQQS